MENGIKILGQTLYFVFIFIQIFC